MIHPPHRLPPHAAPSSPPLQGAGYAHSSSVITFNWTAPLPPDQNGIIDYYNVIVTEVATGREWFLVAIDKQITLASLHPYYNYSCIVAAYTVDIGPFSQPFFALTEEEGNYSGSHLMSHHFKEYFDTKPKSKTIYYASPYIFACLLE